MRITAPHVLVLLWLMPVIARGDDSTTTPRLLRRLDAPPVYTRNLQDTSKWPKIIRHGIDAGRTYFGNYGPVYVYILGHQSKDLNNEEFHQLLAREYCKRRSNNAASQQHCQQRKGTELIQKVFTGRGDAYLSMVDFTTSPFAELVFINPHEFRDPYLYTRGIHEYTHVFQRAFPRTPTWMTEGAAEFFACHLGEKNGWSDLRSEMAKYMKNVQRIEDPELGLQHMENIDQATPKVRKYYRHLAYDGGAWAVALMIHMSSSRKIRDLPQTFYPLVAKHGWEHALVQYTQVKDKQTFYRKFDQLRRLPPTDQLRLLNELRD